MRVATPASFKWHVQLSSVNMCRLSQQYLDRIGVASMLWRHM
jgi:hypothetical protein